MTDPSNQAARRDLSARYADAIQRYRGHHRLLMEALQDDAVGVEAFEGMSSRLQEDVNVLKQIKRELASRRPGTDRQA